MGQTWLTQAKCDPVDRDDPVDPDDPDNPTRLQRCYVYTILLKYKF